MPVRRNVGQKTTIATAIRQNLNSYSDAQILDELLQNADDAQAERAAFMLDWRTHPTERVYGGSAKGKMAELQGPALVAFDSATFKEEDFVGLFSFGQGSKKFDPTRTGKFGLGFNSVYHVTDAPMFVSGEWFVVLDPQKGYYPGLSPQNTLDPGSQNMYCEEAYEELRDQFDPFCMDCFGCDLRQNPSFDGTLFRFPLRTKAQATRYGQHGLRPGQNYTPEMIQRQFEAFQQTAGEKLLFFKHLRSIELWEWRQGEPSPQSVYSVTLSGEQLAQRAVVTNWLQTELDSWERQQPEGVRWKETAGSLHAMLQGVDRHTVPRHTIQFSVTIEQGGMVQEEEWFIRSGVGLGTAWEISVSDYGDKALTLFPSASIAARVASKRSDGSSAAGGGPRLQPFVGRAFATLPTQMMTGFPLHVNARWCYIIISCRRFTVIFVHD